MKANKKASHASINPQIAVGDKQAAEPNSTTLHSATLLTHLTSERTRLQKRQQGYEFIELREICVVIAVCASSVPVHRSAVFDLCIYLSEDSPLCQMHWGCGKSTRDYREVIQLHLQYNKCASKSKNITGRCT